MSSLESVNKLLLSLDEQESDHLQQRTANLAELERKLEPLLTLPKELAQTNQFLTHNYASTVSLRAATYELDRVAAKRQEKMSVASWLLSDFGRLQRDKRCEREISPVFRHHGFNWYHPLCSSPSLASFDPSSLHSTPDYSSHLSVSSVFGCHR